MDGILSVNKPINLTSYQVVREIKRLIGKVKVGHTGTLDPMASGLLLLCLGQATKITPWLINLDKEYHGVMKLGLETDTQDASGKIVAVKDISNLNLKEVLNTAESFIGNQQQLPPMFSAKKHHGTRLYTLARQGLTVPRVPQPITIHRLQILSFEPPLVTFNVKCSKGTYIRSLCWEWGKKLSCGAHLAALERLKIGDFCLANSLTLTEVKAAVTQKKLAEKLCSLDEALAALPVIVINQSGEKALLHGMKIKQEWLLQPDDTIRAQSMVRVHNHKRRLLAVAETLMPFSQLQAVSPSQEVLQPRRLLYS